MNKYWIEYSDLFLSLIRHFMRDHRNGNSKGLQMTLYVNALAYISHSSTFALDKIFDVLFDFLYQC